MRYLILLLLIITGCAKQSFKGNDPGDDLRPYVNSFYDAYEGEEIEIFYLLIPLEDKAAECVTGSDGTRIISVNSDTWHDYCDYQKKALVWHELGHCVLGRAHVEDQISYMLSNIYSCEFYETNEDELDTEMFSPAP